MNPYEILGVDSSSSKDEIEKAYRSLAKKYHPDCNKDDPDASKKFKEVQASYELLKKTKGPRSEFDDVRFRTKAGFNGFEIDINDFFSSSIFKGRNLQARVEVSLFDVLTGSKKEVKIKKRSICSSCSGHGFSDFISCEECGGKGSVEIKQAPFVVNRPCNFCDATGRINVKKCVSCSGKGYSSYDEKLIQINIPPGCEHGSQIILGGEGEKSLKGGKNGDLIILIVIKSDPIFKREGAHVVLEAPVSYTQIVCGCDLVVPCLSGERISLKVPPSTPTTTKFRVKGKGFPHKGSIGDMIVHLRLEVPKNINEEYKKCLETLSFLEKKYITSNRKKWVDSFGS